MSLINKAILIYMNVHRGVGWTQRPFYDWRTRSETIFALASSIQPLKGSPLAVIRVSGSGTCRILNHLTRLQPLRQADGDNVDGSSRNTKKDLLPRRATLARLLEPQANELIDIGLVLWFPRPKSYTGEDTCELHVHGSQAIVKKLMSTLGRFEGVRPAEPGEFTRRAVKNGKMSLLQAESIPELIAAQTDQQRIFALKGLSGATRGKYEKWIDELIQILAHLEASIDFGEDELIGEQRVVNECILNINKLATEISQFIAITSRCRDFAKAGARISIVGKPNAGKSSLMNALCRQERSIVSDLSGTTRDVIEHSFDLNGHMLTLCDTAGLRELTQATGDAQPDVIRQHASVEREGIRRALQNADKADLLLFIIDASQLDAQDDQELAKELADGLRALEEALKNKVIHLVINKTDLRPQMETFDLASVERTLGCSSGAREVQISTVSCKTAKNLDVLVGRISACLDQMRPTVNGDAQLEYANERHLTLLGSTLKHLQRASRLKMANIDEMAQHVRESVDYLSRIVGSVSNERVFDIIFRDFCIGK